MPPIVIVVENVDARKLSMYQCYENKKWWKVETEKTEVRSKQKNHIHIKQSLQTTSFNILGACIVSECFLGLETFYLDSDRLLHLNGGHVPVASELK